MTSLQAKLILLRYRPGTADAEDPEVAEALEQVQRDPDLRLWFEQHCAFQKQVRDTIRGLPVPAPPVFEPKIVPGPSAWWNRRAVWAAAAVLFLTGISLWLWSRPEPADGLENFCGRMARVALREYRMDLRTNEMMQLRQYFASNSAPADYILPNGLNSLPLTGGAVLTWRNKPVSMVCFDRGKQDMVFLFVVQRSNIPDPPPAMPEFTQVSKLMTARWTAGDKTYLLATETNDVSYLRNLF